MLSPFINVKSCLCFFIIVSYFVTLPIKAADAVLFPKHPTEWQLRDKAVHENLNHKLKDILPPLQLPEAPLPNEVKPNEVKAMTKLPKGMNCFVIKHIKVKGLLSEWAESTGKEL